MVHVRAEEARKGLAELLRRAGYGDERIVISVHGRDTAALVPLKDLAVLQQLEDYLDRLDAERILAEVDEGREQTFSLEEADRQLGLS